MTRSNSFVNEKIGPPKTELKIPTEILDGKISEYRNEFLGVADSIIAVDFLSGPDSGTKVNTLPHKRQIHLGL